MKIKQLLELLTDCDPESQVTIHELSGVYETVLLSIDDTDDEVIFNIKTYLKSKKDEDKVH